MVSFSRDPDSAIATPFLGDNKLIREDKKEWLGFIGFIQPGLEKEMRIFRNDFADIQLDYEFFCPPKFVVSTIRVSDDGMGIIIDK